MVVTVHDGNISMKVVQISDLVIEKTEKENIDGQPLYKVTKSRFAKNGKYMTKDQIQGFIAEYENKY